MTKRFGFAILASLLAAGPMQAAAAPPHPELAREIREGRRPLPDYLRELREKGPPKVRGERKVSPILRELKRRKTQESGATLLPTPGVQPAPGTQPFVGAPPAGASAAPPAQGTQNALALLVSFFDVPWWQAASYFDTRVFGFDGSAFGTIVPSMSHYYREVSGDRFTVVTEHLPSVVDWLSLPQTKAYYRANVGAMAQDAIVAADAAGIDFSRYDNDGDGLVDYLILIHVGSGGEFTGENADIWSQTVTVEPMATADGVSVDTFMTVPEYWFQSNFGRMTIGVYAHEFGHLLGLPDLYDRHIDSKGIGDWGLMGLGMWNGVNANETDRGDRPSWPSAWERVALGWVVPEVPTSDIAGVSLPPVEQAGAARGGPVYYLWDGGADNSEFEFFLIENRQQLGDYDAYLPGHGLLVWHIDETMPDNDSQIPAGSQDDCSWPSHYRVALQQADGFMNLEGNVNDGDIGDPYPYPDIDPVTAFSPTSTGDFPPRTPPNSGSYADCRSTVAIRNIAEAAGVITVDLEVNAPDSDIALSPSSVAENAPLDTVVGTFSTTDPYATAPFTYELASGDGDADNYFFWIDGSELYTAEVFDYEAQSSYSVRVKSTDQWGLTVEKAFTIGVTNVNEAPADIALSADSVDENQAAGTAVGTLSATDPDTGETFTYTLEAGTGDADNASFTIVDGELRTAVAFDYETKSSYSILVRATDQGGLFYEEAFTIGVTNANEGPTDIALSPASVAENQAAGTVVGTLSATDPDAGGSFTYAFATGTGDSDNASFAIVDGELRTAAVFDFETKSSYSILVRATDQGGLFYEEAFTIGVTDVNEAPTELDLSGSSVAERQPAGTAVGTFSATDPDTGDSASYALAAGEGDTDNASFTISGGTLLTAAVFDFETKSSYSIRVRATDQGLLWTEHAFTVTIADTNDPPTAIALSGSVVLERQPAGTVVGTLSTADPNPGEAFTYELIAGSGGADNGSFTIVGDQLLAAAIFDFTVQNRFSILVRSTDRGGLPTEQAFTLTAPAFLLWTRSDTGRTALWQVDPATGAHVGAVALRVPRAARGPWVRPYSGQKVDRAWLRSTLAATAKWQAVGYEHVSPTEGYLLRTYGNLGWAVLWKVNPRTGAVKRAAYLRAPARVGRPWQAASYQHVSGAEGYVLWTRSDRGRTVLTKVEPRRMGSRALLPNRGSAYVGSTAGVGGPWLATSYQRISPTEGYVLWTRSDLGLGTLWKIDPSGIGTLRVLPVTASAELNGAAGAGGGWQATSFDWRSASEGSVLWTRNDTGQAALWQIAPGDLDTLGAAPILGSRDLPPVSGLGPRWMATSFDAAP